MRPPNTSTRHAPLEAKVETDKRVREVDLRFLAARVPHAVRLDDALGGTLPSAARETSNPRTSWWTAWHPRQAFNRLGASPA
jgi:hypothetical protein